MKIIQNTLEIQKKSSNVSKKIGQPPKSKVGRVSGNPSRLWQQTHIGAKPPIKTRHFFFGLINVKSRFLMMQLILSKRGF